MENVQVESVNDCRGFESVRVQLRKLARVSKNMEVKQKMYQYVTKMARLGKMYGYNPQRNGADWKVYEYN